MCFARCTARETSSRSRFAWYLNSDNVPSSNETILILICPGPVSRSSGSPASNPSTATKRSLDQTTTSNPFVPPLSLSLAILRHFSWKVTREQSSDPYHYYSVKSGRRNSLDFSNISPQEAASAAQVKRCLDHSASNVTDSKYKSRGIGGRNTRRHLPGTTLQTQSETSTSGL